MNRPSLYGAFGDKHALYAAALERYIAEGRSQMEAALDDELPLRDALMRVYDGALGDVLSRTRARRAAAS